ncbi:MAG TPA: ATP-binding protein [Parvibaculum sp.]|uniref:PAS domain-containing hybrid sensor histidine kinase/response regulator n=1 Tax=Parvibaculum sp. TaxID=2024848 RepID=UPI002C0381FA|nr:ATP-binding protein [Parvibaculum sp.]HMM13707.1 ATP-binding protein [Parvibaculum sp.]
MSEIPAELPELERPAAAEARGGSVASDGDAQGGVFAALPSGRRLVILAGAGLGLAATLLDAFGLHAFGVSGALTVMGVIGAAGVLIFGLGMSGSEAFSRAPLAAGEALNALPDPCYVTDRRGAVIFANEAYRSLLGTAHAERPAPLERLLAGRDGLAETLFRLTQMGRTGFAGEEEVRFSPRAGAVERVFRIVVRPLSGEEGGAVWLLRDLTMERERVEIAERQWQSVMDFMSATPIGFYVAEANGEITFINARLAGWLGIEPDRATERRTTLADFAAGGPGGLPRASALDGTATLDVDLRAGDGRVMPVRIVQTQVSRGAGREPMICAMVLDRATADEAEETMRDAERRFARFFNNAPIGIATVDREGRIDNANSAFRSYVGDVERGANLAGLVAEDDRPGVEEVLGRAQAGTLSGPPIEVRPVNRSERVGLLYASRVDMGEDGGSTVIYLIDATEQKSLELQFAQSQKMQAIGQLAGGVAHDFNNLLTAIIGFCDLLLARHQAGDPSFADVMQIKQNANRAANLTRQLLAFSRRQTLRPKVLSLTDAIAELQNLLSRLLTEKVELKIVHGRDLGLVKVDQNQIEQVIMNLAVNARDAMPDGGRLTIRTANVSEEDSRALDHALMPPGEYVLIEVADTGVGIPKENHGKIFEPFYTTKDPSKGTGLGLSTVYGIVKQTGGFIFLYSTVGKGTTFRIYLPRYFETPAEAKAEAEAAAAASAAEPADLTGKGTILLVEDEDAVRTFAARALTTRGYEVLQAESGEAAIALVEGFKGQIDLVVSDVVMPNMDGPTMIKELRARLPGAKVIFVSGYAEDAFEKSLDPDQEFHFLPKPFSLKQLAAAVKEMMGG